MSIETVLERLNRDPRFCRNITFRSEIPGRQASFAPTPDCLQKEITSLLRERGIEKLYTHQAEALELVANGKDIVVVTPTASGKTLCYNLPVLNTLLTDEEARALYLFPTKALAQDQVADLMVWSERLGGKIKTYTYDGDTPAPARRAIRTAGSIVVTNPDMLHTGILPHHTKWMRLFENLKYVVIDELHTYRGVFGSHVANVLRRLNRICEFYGSHPTFICTSATIANPGEHAARLTGRDVALVAENGAPRAPKELIFYNPPVVNKPLGIRRSSLLEAQAITREFLKEGIQTIVFTRSRLNTEVLVTYLRQVFKKLGDKTEKIRGYRGGYLPQQRRKIEKELREGKVLGVVSTNALELGIDIGTLQAAVITGYPGTIASTWQQIGRAGRQKELSAAILIGNSSPLNQFIINNSSYFMERGVEHALINPDNLVILVSHIKCAAFELPFREGERFGAYNLEEILSFLAEGQILRKVEDKWYWMQEQFPAQEISLRSASADNFVIIDTARGAKVIGEVDRFSAPMLIHEGAIYIHESQQYHIDRLDYEQQKAYARPVDVDYYTDANLAVNLKVLDVFESNEEKKCRRWHGEVMVAARVTIYKKIKFYTHENIGWGDIHLPEEEMHTTAFWLSFPGMEAKLLQKRETDPEESKEVLHGALLGISNLLGNIAPLELMCEPHDLGVTTQVKSPFTGAPTIFIYEKYPGGVGFNERLYAAYKALLQRVYDALKGCSCSDGCPSCVGPIDQVGEFGKENARRLMVEVLCCES